MTFEETDPTTAVTRTQAKKKRSVAGTKKQGPTLRAVTLNDLQKINEEIWRTGISIHHLFMLKREAWPPGLNPQIVNDWFVRGTKGQEKTDYLDYILHAWETYPDNLLIEKKEVPEPPSIPLTESIVQEIRVEIVRTGIGATALLSLNYPGKPEKLKPHIIDVWLKDNKKRPETIRIDHLEYVLSSWKKCPDKGMHTMAARKKTSVAPTKKQKPAHSPITKSVLRKIRLEIDRTGIGIATVLKQDHENFPQGLNAQFVYRWLAGNTKIARTDYLDFMLNAWKPYPDEPAVAREAITEDMIQKIQAEIKRTGIGTATLLKRDKENVPKGLNSPLIYNWLIGITKTAQTDYLEYISQAWAKYPDNHLVERTLITDSMLQKIRAERKRTCIPLPVLLRRDQENVPEGLSAALINNWLQKPENSIKTARTDHLEYILHAWKPYPDVETSYEKVIGRDATEVLVAPSIVSVLKAHKRRTGVSAEMLLKKQAEVPEGLTIAEIIGWLDKHGGVKITQKRYLDFVLQCWESEPHAEKRSTNNSGKQPLTKEIAQKLKDERKRTGVSQTKLLRIFAEDCPKGLNAGYINRWINRCAQTVNTYLLDYVLHCWAQLPDRPKAVSKISALKRPIRKSTTEDNLDKRPSKQAAATHDMEVVHLTDEAITLIRSKMKETGLSLRELFAARNDHPEGFNWKYIHAYLQPGRKVFAKGRYDYIIRVCEENKGKGYIPISEDVKQRILSEVERTGISIYRLLRKRPYAQGVSPKVSAATVHSWLQGKTQKALPGAMEYVFSMYARLPDKSIPTQYANTGKKAMPMQPEKKPYKGKGDYPIEEKEYKRYKDLRQTSLKPISIKQLERLRYYRDRYRFLPSKILKVVREPPPAGLNQYMISSWLNGGTKTAAPELIKWVLKRCEEYENFQEK